MPAAVVTAVVEAPTLPPPPPPPPPLLVLMPAPVVAKEPERNDVTVPPGAEGGQEPAPVAVAEAGGVDGKNALLRWGDWFTCRGG